MSNCNWLKHALFQNCFIKYFWLQPLLRSDSSCAWNAHQGKLSCGIFPFTATSSKVIWVSLKLLSFVQRSDQLKRRPEAEIVEHQNVESLRSSCVGPWSYFQLCRLQYTSSAEKFVGLEQLLADSNYLWTGCSDVENLPLNMKTCIVNRWYASWAFIKIEIL